VKRNWLCNSSDHSISDNRPLREPLRWRLRSAGASMQARMSPPMPVTMTAAVVSLGRRMGIGTLTSRFESGLMEAIPSTFSADQMSEVLQ
jgi:hypothetical protein